MNTESLAPARWLQLWSRYRHLVAVFSFAAGLASFLLVQRQERVAQALVFLLPLSWLIALLETRLLQDRLPLRWQQPSQALLRYLTQALHQESFFFTLPFFLATTNWASPQTLFLLLLGTLALISMIDPLYFGEVLLRRPLLWLFHASAGFVTVLTAAPMLWQIDTASSLRLAIATAGLLSLPMFHALLRGRPPWRLALTPLCSLLLCAALWLLRPTIPPSTLSVHDAQLSWQVDEQQREPNEPVTQISAAELAERGLYAWTPIHAPRGLHETIAHQWWHEGQLVDVIPIQISGGREQGYRAWTHKTAFGEDPRGDWQLRVVTQSDQLIGQLRFRVQ